MGFLENPPAGEIPVRVFGSIPDASSILQQITASRRGVISGVSNVAAHVKNAGKETALSNETRSTFLDELIAKPPVGMESNVNSEGSIKTDPRIWRVKDVIATLAEFPANAEVRGFQYLVVMDVGVSVATGKVAPR